MCYSVTWSHSSPRLSHDSTRKRLNDLCTLSRFTRWCSSHVHPALLSHDMFFVVCLHTVLWAAAVALWPRDSFPTGTLKYIFDVILQQRWIKFLIKVSLLWVLFRFDFIFLCSWFSQQLTCHVRIINYVFNLSKNLLNGLHLLFTLNNNTQCSMCELLHVKSTLCTKSWLILQWEKQINLLPSSFLFTISHWSRSQRSCRFPLLHYKVELHRSVWDSLSNNADVACEEMTCSLCLSPSPASSLLNGPATSKTRSKHVFPFCLREQALHPNVQLWEMMVFPSFPFFLVLTASSWWRRAMTRCPRSSSFWKLLCRTTALWVSPLLPPAARQPPEKLHCLLTSDTHSI